MPNEYSDFLDDAPAPETNEYKAIVDPSPALVQAQNHETAAPDEAAKTLQASKALGIPYALGALDHQDTQVQAKRQAAQQRIRANPFLQEHIDSDPAAAQLSNDDWDKLDGFSKAWHIFTDYDGVGRLATMLGAPAIGTGAQRGFVEEAAGSARALGNAPKAEDLAAGVEHLPQYPNGIAHYTDMLGTMIGQLGFQASTGGALGAAAGTPAGPGGAVVGFMGGIAAAASQAAYGRTLMSFDKAEKETGQQIDPTAKHLAAGAIGLLSGGANFIGVKAGGEAVGSLLSEAAVSAMTKPGVAAALGQFAKTTAKGGAQAAGLMGGLTLADQTLQDAAKSVGGDWQTIYNNPDKRYQLVESVASALADGFVLGGALHMIPAGRNAVNDIRLAKEAALDKDNLANVIKARTESATAERSPESFQNFANLHGDEKLVISPEGVMQAGDALESMGATALPDGSAEVPLATYAAMVPEEVHRAIADDIIHREDGVSVNQAKELKGLSGADRFLNREQPQVAANEAGGVFDTWESRRHLVETVASDKHTALSTQMDALIAAGDVEGATALRPELEKAAADYEAAREGSYGRKLSVAETAAQEFPLYGLGQEGNLEAMLEAAKQDTNKAVPYLKNLRDNAQKVFTRVQDEILAELPEGHPFRVWMDKDEGERPATLDDAENSLPTPLLKKLEDAHEQYNAFSNTVDQISRGNFYPARSRPQLQLPAYQTGVPTTVDAFHGTAADFIHGEGFNPEKLGSATGAKSAEEATFFARNPETSESYTGYAVGEDADFFNHMLLPPAERKQYDALKQQIYDVQTEADNFYITSKPGEKNPFHEKVEALQKDLVKFEQDHRDLVKSSPQMIQARLNFENPFVYDFKGKEYREESYYNLIREAKEKGHDGAIFLNTTDGGPNDVIYAVFNGHQIGHRLDTDARRSAGTAQKYLTRSAEGDVVVANDQVQGMANAEMAPAIPKAPDLKPLQDQLASLKTEEPELKQAIQDGKLRGENTQAAEEKLKVNGQAQRATKAAIRDATPKDAAALATTEAEAQMYLEPLFQGPNALLMGKAEFERYNKLLEAKADDRHAALVKRAEADARLRQTPDYLARVADVTEEVTRNVDERPVFVADRLARTGLDADGTRLSDTPGAFKLDREIVDAVSRPGTADLLGGLVKKGGIHPDELAGITGHGSGAELVQELLATSSERQRLGLTPKAYREAVIKAEVQDRMLERYGDLDENIRAEALDAAVRPTATELLNAEREALATLAGGKPEVSLDQMRANAAAAFAEAKATDGMDVARYAKAVGRAGRQAELALLRGDFVKAFAAKQAQMQAMLFAEQAKAFARTQAQTAKVLKTYADNRTLPAVDQRFTDQIHNILRELGVEQSRDIGEIWESTYGRGSSPGQFIERMNGQDEQVPLPTEPLPQKAYADFTVAEAHQLSDLVKALNTAGRNAKKVMLDNEKVDLDRVIEQVRQNVADLKEKFDPQAKGSVADLMAAGRYFDASMLKMEQMIDNLDKANPNGVLNRVVFRRLNAAKNFRQKLIDDLSAKMMELGTDKKWTKSLDDALPNTELMDPHVFNGQVRPFAMTRKELLSVMLNMGNEGNMRVLAEGMKWDPAAIKQFVDKHARAEDWHFVQGIWDTFKMLEPHIDKTYRDMVGIGPEFVKGNRVTTPHGTFEGGYFPLVSDPLRNATDAEGNLVSYKAGRDELFGNGQFQPMPANGYTKARTGATYPLLLNPDFIPTMLYRTAHDVAMRPALMDAKKVLLDPRFKDIITRTMGKEYSDLLHPYLQGIAQNGFRDIAGDHWLNSIIRPARQRAVGLSIGLNLGTVAIHGTGAYLNSIGEILMEHGPVAAAKSAPFITREFIQNGIAPMVDKVFRSEAAYTKAYKEAMAESAEMRNRHVDFERDARQLFDKAIGERDWRKSWNQVATAAVGNFDLASALPTYITARDLYIAKGMAREDAIYAAEKMVRKAHGSNSIVDLAAIQRGPEALKLFTMFFGYFNHVYNRYRFLGDTAVGAVTDAQKGAYMDSAYKFGKVLGGSLFYVLFPSLIHAMIRHPKSHDEGYGHWIGNAIATQLTGTLPFVRNVPFALHSGRPVDLLPLNQEANVLLDAGKDWSTLLFGGGHGTSPSGVVKHSIQAAGVLGNVSGSGQAGRAAQFLWDTKIGKEHPEGFPEWWRGIMTGHAKERKH